MTDKILEEIDFPFQYSHQIPAFTVDLTLCLAKAPPVNVSRL